MTIPLPSFFSGLGRLIYDSDLVKRCLKKDRKAQNRLYQDCYDLIMSISYRYARSNEEAIEYVNVGFLKVLMNLKKYKPNVPFELWVRRVVINELLDQIRKKKRYKERVELQGSDVQLEVAYRNQNSNEDQSGERMQWLREKSAMLPQMTAKVFSLYAFDGYKHAEIAKMLGMSEGTSQWHYSIAKKRLKQWYAEDKEI